MLWLFLVFCIAWVGFCIALFQILGIRVIDDYPPHDDPPEESE